MWKERQALKKVRWTPKVLVDKLEFTDWSESRFRDWLVGRGRNAARVALIKARTRRDLAPQAFLNAGRYLIYLGDPRAADLLLRALHTQTPRIWETVFDLLAQTDLRIDPEKFEPLLLGCLWNPGGSLSISAIRAIGRRPTPALKERLRELVRHEDLRVSAQAAYELLTLAPNEETLDVAGQGFLKDLWCCCSRQVPSTIRGLALSGPMRLREKARTLLAQYVTERLARSQGYWRHVFSDSMCVLAEVRFRNIRRLLERAICSTTLGWPRGVCLSLLLTHCANLTGKPRLLNKAIREQASEVLRSLVAGAYCPGTHPAIGITLIKAIAKLEAPGVRTFLPGLLGGSSAWQELLKRPVR
ncbi:MAG TPA: hypothetical protein VMT52_00740 [Planctomycetota bacterium]|nr:hypothetical protein [Planctomycetota bacterium]